ncbi:MAG: CRTAC1 family protein [Verrucomicrobia bacterium]|nr:CRTAC1 family protein [Verrucomicrobiota bacterium]
MVKRGSSWTERKRVMRAIPAVGVNVTTYRAYGKAGISELLGERANLARRLTAATTDSMIFLNRGDRFEARPLPIEAQFAPVFGVTVADFDGDGNEDLFLAQNFFGVDLETSRHDGGAGLMLTGDGRGGFRSLAPAVSGIAIYGQQRGSAAADFDGDGRMDLAVGQNRGQTALYRNQGGLPGVRIRLRGSRGNPHAVGATVRVRHGDRWSRLVEIHAGAGYWSQDSAVALFAATSLPTSVQVRWPDGKRQEHTWPALQKSVDVSKEGIRSAQ